MTEVRVEYGLRIDCALQGCDEPHFDNGDVLRRRYERPTTTSVNGHAVTLVQRTVTWAEWESSDRPGLSGSEETP
ncbi:hypothetical protein [Nocardioides sp. GY 10127]|uniref:hypothetical protein n=1 Tax=Nocardioides sp. GY 10127 TaxID=2569762 RepID=UPI0010A92BC1|nr:hypothetical protein [Nocardioides sp. GY 10127]TIC78792.1 hypothetical protein E8D37_19035 [Nocardioides sp. GY 10127]